MPIDLGLFADKLRRYCDQFAVALPALAEATGIASDRLQQMIEQRLEPTGDEVLILADYFMCDFRFFISNEKLAPFEQTEQLFRMHGDILTQADRWAIQEFLFLCECEEFLVANLPSAPRRERFIFQKEGTYYKGQGEEAAVALRRHLGYQAYEATKDIYRDLRQIGMHVFRRKLGNSAVSGLFVRHPVAGPCVLVNYSQDVFRQRFSAAHEAGHAILDDQAAFVVSFTTWDGKDLSEIRANTFASRVLIPPEFLDRVPEATHWTPDKLLEWSIRLMVNPEPLAYALLDSRLITAEQTNELKATRVPRRLKVDPELPERLSAGERSRKERLLERGLSAAYVGLCLDAYQGGVVSAGRLAEMLLTPATDIADLAALFGRRMVHAN